MFSYIFSQERLTDIESKEAAVSSLAQELDQAKSAAEEKEKELANVKTESERRQQELEVNMMSNLLTYCARLLSHRLVNLTDLI